MRWQLTAHQPDEAYERLSWEVTLAPNDYVLVGTRLERPDTLGQRCFLTTDGPAPVQRLLVIRTCRVQPSAPHDGGHGKPPPLAFQAGWFSARGVAP
jgi:hypothetical protein